MPKSALFASAAFISALSAVACACSTGSFADIILFNGNVVPVDDQFTHGQAVAIAGGKILSVGTNDEIRKLGGPATRQIDLKGKTVIPGLIDAHVHDAGDGPGVDLSKARTLD